MEDWSAGFWRLFGIWPIGTIAGFIILALGAIVFFVMLTILSSIFGFVALIAGAFFFLVVSLMQSAMDDADRKTWGRLLWIIPLGIWFGGAIGKMTGVTNSLELSFAQVTQLTTLSVSDYAGLNIAFFVVIALFMVIGFVAFAMRDQIS